MPRFRSFVVPLAVAAAGAIATGAAATAIPTDWGVLTQVLVPLQGGGAGASGNVSYQLDWRAHKVCYALNTTGVEVTGAMIAKGKAGQSGQQVVDVKPRGRPGAQTWDGCIDTDPELVKAIIDNPGDYYFAVKTAANPNGALRTQLDAKGMDLS